MTIEHNEPDLPRHTIDGLNCEIRYLSDKVNELIDLVNELASKAEGGKE